MTGVIEHVEGHLAAAREDAARALDRVDALVGWRSKLLVMAAELDTPELTVDQMWAGCADEQQRAHLNALVTRALPPIEGTDEND